MAAPAAPSGRPRRWWAGGLWLPQDRQPVFIIPWHNGGLHRWQYRDTEYLLKSGRWVHHHIFPQEQRLASWFTRQGIDIHQFTLVMPESVHRRLHGGGPGGGMWNEAWREFVLPRWTRSPTHAEIWAHAHLLIRRFHLNPGPFVPYR